MENKKNIEIKAQCDPENAIQFKDKTVLIVEDDRSHRVLMDKILQSCEFKTVQAENGFIALSKIDAGQHFDLVVMDWDMPELDGLETVKAIRMREVKDGKAHLPVLAFTAKRNPGDKEACLAAGMDAYLPKEVFLPKWRQTLIDNLQGLFAGNFDPKDFEDQQQQTNAEQDFDLSEFDVELFEQSAALLKDELGIAIEEYLEDAAAYICEIEEGLEAGDITKVARGSHPLKSNSKAFGLISVCKIAEAINAPCERSENKETAIQNAHQLFPQLKEAFANGEGHLKTALKLHS